MLQLAPHSLHHVVEAHLAIRLNMGVPSSGIGAISGHCLHRCPADDLLLSQVVCE